MNNDILQISKNLGIRHNVYFRVIDKMTNTVVQQVSGHNDATNSMLTGIGYYLAGNGVANQAYSVLTKYVPKYISLGTMGLLNQDQEDCYILTTVSPTDWENNYTSYFEKVDDEYIPVSGASAPTWEPDKYYRLVTGLPAGIDFDNYVSQVPGYGADGWDAAENNGREVFGLGYKFDDTVGAINCELISDSFPRTAISFRDVVPEVEAELPKTIDVIYSAMISIGALQQFRGSRDYIFITEAGLWSEKTYQGDNSGENGLLAGYRILPPNSINWDMSDENNRNILRQNILRVGKNQVVQVIWKVQLGSISQIAKVEDQDDINELMAIIGEEG